MKTKWIILGCTALAGAGLYYLFAKRSGEENQTDQDPVGPVNDHGHAKAEDSAGDHLRGIMHKAKELAM